ncbi:hypothetical protein ALC53_09751 [Atta colombica]|uniref:Uncharacterized protein n=1 Tax=Atta colombica TaxID=520822 RepID=A0A195B6L7_9HYME|nr:hypothetical protein ALC53_09751 [Atta colombica]
MLYTFNYSFGYPCLTFPRYREASLTNVTLMEIDMKYYNNRNFFVPHCKPARKATPKMDISTDTGRSTSNPVESANDCITKSFFWASNRRNQLQLYNHLWAPEIISDV